MGNVSFILFVLVTYPILAFFIISLTQNNILVRKIIFFVLLAITILVFSVSFNGISTIYLTLNWVLGLTIYLFISVILWLLNFQKNKIVKVLSVVGMVFVFGFGVFLGLDFIFFNNEAEVEKKFSNGLIYREYTLGHTTTSNRGKQVKIYKIVSWLPIIEVFVQEKTYDRLICYYDGKDPNYENKLTVNYQPNDDKMYLSAFIWGGNEKEMWADTLIIKNTK